MRLLQYKIRFSLFLVLLAGSTDSVCLADGPIDNSVQTVRPVPPPGIQIDEQSRQELQNGLEQLQATIGELRKSKNPIAVQYLPDVEIFEKALRIALTEDGFFEPRDVEGARKLLGIGKERANELKLGSATWLGNFGNSGLTVRGYRSKLDGSVQPYGVAWNQPGGRGDVWCRGRSEKGLELQFMVKQLTNPDPLPVAGVCMIYPMGRYCNANKLAGEVDTLETLEHALAEYPINPKQVSIRGFSMGGAAAWHLAVHYPDKWFAATPGAGFSETPEFLKVFQSETLSPTPYEQTLWQLYDCNKWALNLKNLPTIAYSGAIDKQKQAADVMAEACWKLPGGNGFELTHIVAPDTAHKISLAARDEIERRLSEIHSLQRWAKVVPRIWFTTFTLKYNRCHWLTIEKLQQHWQPATVKADLIIKDKAAFIEIDATGATELSLNFEASQMPQAVTGIIVNFRSGSESFPKVSPFSRRSDLSFRAKYRFDEGNNSWSLVSPLEPDSELRKRHNLQGPIDDAFMDSFLFVKPNSTGQNAAIDHWVNAEFERAVKEWHRQMRGDVRIVEAGQLKETDIKSHNIILWGDPQSNSQLANIVQQLPITWTSQELAIGMQKFDARSHLPIMIYPNPLAPNRYVVLNSSFTYREYDYLNNARQVPKLPDWAVVDVRTAPDTRWPGKIVAADFFDEKWAIKK